MKLRLALVLISGACSSPSHLTVDAPGAADTGIDADLCAPQSAPDGCVANGLAGVDLSGAWTFTGTSHSTFSPTPMSATFAVQLSVTGSCASSVNFLSASAMGYANVTAASYYAPGLSILAVTICGAADTSIAFHATNTANDGCEECNVEYDDGTLTH